MKIISYNVSFSLHTSPLIKDISAIIESEKPDILCLQEYDKVKDINDLLIKNNYLINYTQYFKGKRIAQGLLTAIKKGYTVVESNSYLYPDILLKPPFRVYKCANVLKILNKNKQMMHIINVHLPIYWWKHSKVQKLNDLIRSLDSNENAINIICGDFNMLTKNAQELMVQEMKKSGYSKLDNKESTFKPFPPRKGEGLYLVKSLLSNINRVKDIKLELDYIFTNDPNYNKKEMKVLNYCVGSDHCAISAEI